MQMGVVMCPRQWDKYENFPHQLNCYMYETDTPLLLEMRHGKPASACLAIFPLVKTWSVGQSEESNLRMLFCCAWAASIRIGKIIMKMYHHIYNTT